MTGALIAFAAALAGVVAGAALARHNERRAHAGRLLTDALDDLVVAIANVVGGAGREARRAYAAANARIVLHGSPAVVDAFRALQVDPTTGTEDGRMRLLAAFQEARRELGRPPVDPKAASVLLFGSISEPSEDR